MENVMRSQCQRLNLPLVLTKIHLQSVYNTVILPLMPTESDASEDF